MYDQDFEVQKYCGITGGPTHAVDVACCGCHSCDKEVSAPIQVKGYIEEEKYKENPRAYQKSHDRDIENYMRTYGVSRETAVMRLYRD